MPAALPNPNITYPDLPVANRREEIMDAMRKHQVVIVVGETGSGKTTQLPKMAYALACEEGKTGRVGCTQPRRLAAATVARRVAGEMGSELGGKVGYQVRFVEKVQQQTVIKFMTDGILLAESQRDRNLSQYDTLIIDEAHERSLNIDFILGYLKNLIQRRKNLRIVVSSATLDAGKFSDYFDGAPVVNVEGRTFPVEDHFMPPLMEREELSRHVARAVEWVTGLDRGGDILIFLAGEQEIRECAEMLQGRQYANMDILPLFARLGLDEQERVFKTGGANRRVVLATNVAETSVTIPGIVYVIDSGLARVSRWNPSRQIQRLQVEQISQASARQRRGRCGRISEGVCVRLYSEEVLDLADEYTDPEIRRSSLAGVILRMKSLRLPDVREFPFLSPPTGSAITEGHRTLEELGAIEVVRSKGGKGESGRLTHLGYQLARLPLDPRLGRMLIEGARRGVLDAVLVMVGGMSVMDVRERPQEKQEEADRAHRKFNDVDSDFLTLLHIWSAVGAFREKRRFKRNQLRKFCKQNYLSFRRVMEWDQIVAELGRLARDTLKVKIRSLPSERDQWGDEDELHKSLMAGIPMQFGFWDQEKKHYRSTGSRQFSIFPGSGLFGNKKPEWLLAFELVETSRVWARKVAKMEVSWVEELVPHLCSHSYHSPHWNDAQGAVDGKETVRCGGLTLVDERRVFYGRVLPKEAHEVFVRDAILGGGLRTKGEFLQRLAEVREQVERIENKWRRAGGLWSEDAVYDFFIQRIPENICTAKAFQQWRATGDNEEQLMITLQDGGWGELEDQEGLPDEIWHGENCYQLSYAQAPGERTDGVVFELSLSQMADFPDFFPSWGVRGWLEERVYVLIRSLPKIQRQYCSPGRVAAQDFVKEWSGWEPIRFLLDELADFLSKRVEQRIEVQMFDPERMPHELRPKLRVWSEGEQELAFGEDAKQIRQQLSGLMRERRELAVNADWEMTGGEQWSFGELPEVTEDGVFPALVDEGETVGMRAFLDRADAQESHRAGCVRLFQMEQKSHFDYVKCQFPLGMMGKLMLPVMDSGQGELMVDLLRVACEGAMGVTMPRSEEGFVDAAARGKGELYGCASKVADAFESMTESYRRISDWIEDHRGDRHLQVVVEDLAEEIDWLLTAGFVWRSGYGRFVDYTRYFSAMEERIKRLSSLPLFKDEEKRERVQRLWRRWYDAWKEAPGNAAWWEAGWLLMEWRVAEFAPSLPRKGKVSEKRVEVVLEALGL
ncbi:MAG: ATP-dependent RNA helicase HrpA [Verrucomicrobiales bacterium]|nr:ATP-dependent RNA helicase HrpA [Verrucomicrobiales bacterium]